MAWWEYIFVYVGAWLTFRGIRWLHLWIWRTFPDSRLKLLLLRNWGIWDLLPQQRRNRERVARASEPVGEDSGKVIPYRRLLGRKQ